MAQNNLKKVLVLGGSLSDTSVNQQFAEYAAKQLTGVQLTIVKLQDFYPLPVFSPQELAKGKDPNAVKFYELLLAHDAVVLSLSENNFSYSTAFKNLIDWVSRVAPNYDQTWAKKSFLLLAATPSPQGGNSVFNNALFAFPILGANVVASFLLQGFYQKFQNGALTDADAKKGFDEAIAKFQAALN